MRGLRGVGIQGLANPVFSAGCPGGLSLANTILLYNPVTYWPMKELTGVTAINYGSLAAANATYNGVTLDQIGAPGGGRAGYWDGSNDLLRFPATYTNIFQTNTGTLVFWARIPVWPNFTCKFYAMSNGAGTYFAIGVAPSGNLRSEHEGGAGTEIAYSNTSSWFMVSCRWSAAEKFKWYIDTTLKLSAVSIPTVWTPSINFSSVGGFLNIGSQYTPGYFSDLAYYDYVLDTSVLASMFAAGGV